MSNKTKVIVPFTIAVFIGAMVLNFPEFMMGNDASVKNIVVTLVYLAVWIFLLKVGIKNKNRAILIYGAIFWIVNLLIYGVTVYVNATGASVDLALPFAVLFLGQWYGFRFFADSLWAISVIITAISSVMLVASLIPIKQPK